MDKLRTTGRPHVYRQEQEVVQALAMVAQATRWICGKRLVAALPDLAPALEREGMLRLTAEERDALPGLSAVRVDHRLVEQRRRQRPRGLAMAKPCSLLKSWILVRTYTPWDEQATGCVELDLHCEGAEAVAALEGVYDLPHRYVDGYLPVMKLMGKE